MKEEKYMKKTAAVLAAAAGAYHERLCVSPDGIYKRAVGN